VGLRIDLDTEARGKILWPLPRIEPRLPDRPARSQTLYWLSYPAYHLPGSSEQIRKQDEDSNHYKYTFFLKQPICVFFVQNGCSAHGVPATRHYLRFSEMQLMSHRIKYIVTMFVVTDRNNVPRNSETIC
jgi:hypothetical protein